MDIIFLAIISLVLVFKLTSILGRRDSDQQELKINVKESVLVEPKVVIDRNLSPEEQLVLIDPSYDKSNFLENSKSAFKMILEAYAEGKTDILADLLDIEMIRKLAYAISKREENKQICEINILKVGDIGIETIKLENSTAEIVVNIDAEVIMYICDQNKHLIHGDLNKIEKLKDQWIFKRNLKNSDPTWKLISSNNVPFINV